MRQSKGACNTNWKALAMVFAAGLLFLGIGVTCLWCYDTSINETQGILGSNSINEQDTEEELNSTNWNNLANSQFYEQSGVIFTFLGYGLLIFSICYSVSIALTDTKLKNKSLRWQEPNLRKLPSSTNHSHLKKKAQDYN